MGENNVNVNWLHDAINAYQRNGGLILLEEGNGLLKKIQDNIRQAKEAIQPAKCETQIDLIELGNRYNNYHNLCEQHRLEKATFNGLEEAVKAAWTHTIDTTLYSEIRSFESTIRTFQGIGKNLGINPSKLTFINLQAAQKFVCKKEYTRLIQTVQQLSKENPDLDALEEALCNADDFKTHHYNDESDDEFNIFVKGVTLLFTEKDKRLLANLKEETTKFASNINKADLKNALDKYTEFTILETYKELQLEVDETAIQTAQKQLQLC